MEIEFGKLHLPEFDVPEGYSAYEYLTKLCLDGYKKKISKKRQQIETVRYTDGLNMNLRL